MKAIVVLLAVATGMSVVASGATVAKPPDATVTWSKATRGLQARVTLVEKPAINGTRSLVPYLEIRNVGNSASPLKVRCGDGHVKFELVDADGKVVREGKSLRRSGPHADPGTVTLPHDTSIRVGMYCSNWGVPKDAAAMISTDSGAWVLKPEERGKVFLRATVTGKPEESDPDRTWHGTVKLPPVKVEWSKEPSKPEFTFSSFSRKEDTIAATLDKERVMFTVASPRGIGSGTINLKAGDWPKEIVILLTYSDGKGFRNLENFRLKTARIRASGWLGASSKVPFTFLDMKGDFEPLESGWEGGTLDMKVEKSDKGIELRLPPRMLVGSKSLEVHWIDAHRR